MKRKCYEQLLEWKLCPERKPLILNGVRQVGKTTLLCDFAEREYQALHYINLEEDIGAHSIFASDLNPDKIINELSFYLDVPIDREKDFLFIDEIQACPNAITSFKYFAEQCPQMHVAGAGSLLGVHLNTESYPVGKVDMLSLHPLTFTEFLLAVRDTKSVNLLEQLTLESKLPTVAHEHLWMQLKTYFVVGGLPEVVQTYITNKDDAFTAMQLVRKKQQELISAYMADMAKHAENINAMHLNRIWSSLPKRLAREQDGSAAKFRFKGVIPGVNRYRPNGWRT